ncbi:LysR family transcriptional regulator [Vibrio parahaemolyticus]
MNLRQLEVFYAIMQTGTVSGAAKNLHVSQPNVTRVLAHTEQQLGFALFERVKGRLVPTPEAKTLLPEAEKIYQQLGQFRTLTTKVKNGQQPIRHLPHAALPTIEQTLEANLLAARVTNPKVQFVGICLNTSILKEAEAQQLCQQWSEQFGLPVSDPVRFGVTAIADHVANL